MPRCALCQTSAKFVITSLHYALLKLFLLHQLPHVELSCSIACLCCSHRLAVCCLLLYLLGCYCCCLCSLKQLWQMFTPAAFFSWPWMQQAAHAS
jgi:hypothetical protein